MVTTFLIVHPWLTTVGLLALLIGGPLLGAWLVGRTRLTVILLVAAGAVMTALTLAPTSRELKVGCAAEWSLPTLGAVELIANLVLFTPIVLLAGIATGRPILMIVAGSGLSALIEVMQAFIPALGRSCSTNDWLYNSLGALLGGLLAMAALWLAGKRRRRGVV